MDDSPSILWSTAEVADAVAALPAEGPLPVRTIVLPDPRMAHPIRRILLEAGRADALAGTTFTTPSVAAHEVLRSAGVEFDSGEESLRRLRLRDFFDATPDLDYFPGPLLRDTLGWDDAFARTIGDLERAGVAASDLSAGPEARRLGDIRRAWEYLDERAGSSWTSARILVEAAARLRSAPTAWPFEGETLVVMDPDQSSAQVRFLAAIPNAARALLAARPLRARTLERVRGLLGDDTVEALRGGSSPGRDGSSECALLRSYLFEPAETLASGDRFRSTGSDQTVRFEEHSGVDEEIDGAVSWVVEQVLEHQTPLGDIAILAPARDPYLELLVARLERLTDGDGNPLSVLFPDGLPAASRPEGARLLQLVQALRSHLDRASVAGLLPHLRVDEGERRLSKASASNVVHSLGALGGSPADPARASDWRVRVAERLAVLDEQLRDPENLRRPWDVEELRRNMGAIQEPLSELADLAAECAAENASGAWSKIRAYAEKWLVLPPPPIGLVGRLDEVFASADARGATPSAVGRDALRVIEDLISDQRVSSGRVGDPGIYVATVVGAAGLRFEAVRVVGLVEGAVPSIPREDPVLPDNLRAQLGRAMRTSEDAAASQLHVLDRLVRNTTGRIAFSAPRFDSRRSQREVSSIFVELAAALGRPPSVGDDRVIPDAATLERDYFGPSRLESDAALGRAPLLPSVRHSLVARGLLAPPEDGLAGATDYRRVADLLDPAAPVGPLDGVLGPDALAGKTISGLQPDRPTSASALSTFLGCPYAYLLERVLGFRELDEPPSAGSLEANTFGTLLHKVWESFARQYGETFASREDDLGVWLARGDAVVDAEFQQLMGEYALAGDGVREQQRARARRAFRSILGADWVGGTPRRYAGSEVPFGADDGLEVTTPSGPLYLRGFMDRIDHAGGVTLVRDLKSGKAHPRAAGDPPDHGLDLQIGLYGLVLRELAGELGVPETIAAAYFYPDEAQPERRFEGNEFQALVDATNEWLTASAQLLREGAFPRTPNEDDCQYCAYKPVCGAGATGRARAQLPDAGRGTQLFAAIKGFGPEQGEDDE